MKRSLILTPTGNRARNVNDRFGYATSLYPTDTVLATGVPAHSYNVAGADTKLSAGAVWVYFLFPYSELKLVAPSSETNSRNINDFFGQSVAMAGDYLFIGSPGHDYDLAGANSVDLAGCVWVFQRQGNGFVFHQKLIQPANRTSNDFFGYSVAAAIIGGVEVVAIGSPNHDLDAGGLNPVTQSGAVHVFKKDGGNVFQFESKIVPTGVNARNSSDSFGYALSLSSNFLAVSSENNFDAAGANEIAPDERFTGAVFIYETTTWTQSAKVVPTSLNARATATDGTRNVGGGFGEAVSIRNDRLVVGSPYHGYDGSGAASQVNKGAVFLFDTAAWNETEKLVSPQIAQADNSLYGDATQAEFGGAVSQNSDSVFVFDGNPLDHAELNPISGAHSVYAFYDNGTNWVSYQKLVGQGKNARIAPNTMATANVLEGRRFGFSIAAGEDHLVISDPLQSFDRVGDSRIDSAGRVYVFEKVIETSSETFGLPNGSFSSNAGLSWTKTTNDQSEIVQDNGVTFFRNEYTITDPPQTKTAELIFSLSNEDHYEAYPDFEGNVDGVTVTVRVREQATGSITFSKVQLDYVDTDETILFSQDKSAATALANTFTDAVFGGAADQWNFTTPIKLSLFRNVYLRLEFDYAAANATDRVEIDAVSLTINYTLDDFPSKSEGNVKGDAWAISSYSSPTDPPGRPTDPPTNPPAENPINVSCTSGNFDANQVSHSQALTLLKEFAYGIPVHVTIPFPMCLVEIDDDFSDKTDYFELRNHHIVSENWGSRSDDLTILISCQHSCRSGCETRCEVFCETTCETSCEPSCQARCEQACQATCESFCQTPVMTSCQSSCTNTCQDACQTSCTTSCVNGCESSFQKAPVGCVTFCETNCQTDVQNACLMACEVKCQSAAQLKICPPRKQI